MKRLCLIIPTHDRAACISEYLSQTAETAREFGLNIVIWDTSPNEDTAKVVAYQRDKGFENIQYARSPEPAEAMGIDRKVVVACKAYCGQYDYLWFSSDGTVVNIQAVLPELMQAMEEGYDMVGLRHTDASGEEPTTYTQCTVLFRNCCWWLTSLTSMVISTELLEQAFEVLPLDSSKFHGLWLPMSVFHVLSQRTFRALELPVADFWRVNPQRDDSFWKVSGNCLWQWGKVWCDAVDSLPPVYNTEKKSVLRAHDDHVHLFSFRHLVSMKPDGNLTIKKVQQYQKYLPRVTNTSIFWFYFVAIFVNGWVVRVAKTCYHNVKSNQKK